MPETNPGPASPPPPPAAPPPAAAAPAPPAGKKTAVKKKRPVKLAVIDQTGCTGCEACIVFCPVDCILVSPNPEMPGVNTLVEIELERCIGCALCAQYCPWDTIPMLPTDEGLKVAPELTLRPMIYKDRPFPTPETL